MLKHLRRWHFDLAFFLGLAIFSWAYWYPKPRPAWTIRYADTETPVRRNSSLLGFSEDSQFLYTTQESYALTKDCPVPQIQKWDARTGKLLNDYSVELPEEDRFLLQLKRNQPNSSYNIMLCNDPGYFLIQYHQSKEQDHHYLRLYGIDGKPVGQGIELENTAVATYISHRSVSPSHWGVYIERKSNNDPTSYSILDFDTGKTIRVFPLNPDEKLSQIQYSPNHRFLLIVNEVISKQAKLIEVIDLLTGECCGRFSIPAGRDQILIPLDDTHWVFCPCNGGKASLNDVLEVYHFVPDANTLQVDLTHPWNGFSIHLNHLLGAFPPCLLLAKTDETKRNDPEWVKVIIGWLARIGLSRDVTLKQNYQVFDLATKRLERQVTGISSDAVMFSPDLHSLVEIRYGPPGLAGFSLYHIPHYLWEPTLSWMQWLSWLLVIPWPLRYFVASRQNSLVPNTTT